MPEHSERVRRNYPEGVPVQSKYLPARPLIQYQPRDTFVVPFDPPLRDDGSTGEAARVLTEQAMAWYTDPSPEAMRKALTGRPTVEAVGDHRLQYDIRTDTFVCCVCLERRSLPAFREMTCR